MVTTEEIGNILSRLVTVDDRLLDSILIAAYLSEHHLLPEDANKLFEWAKTMRGDKVPIKTRPAREPCL